MVTQIGAIQVRPLTPDDVTEDIAAGIMRALLDAYVHRFGSQYREEIAERWSVDPQNSAHIRWTLSLLSKGPDEGWFWAAALEQIGDTTVVHGFAVAKASCHHEISLADIHTHPDSQRRGIATAVLNELLQFIGSVVQVADTALLLIKLFVARERPHDEFEHPFAWYRAVGFVQDNEEEVTLSLGERTLPMAYMKASLSSLRANLCVDRAKTVD